MKTISHLLLLAYAALPALAEPTVHPLWSGPEIPQDPGQLPEPMGLVNRTIHDAREADYKFLHGAAIIHFKGTFYANWANSPINENYPNETLQGKHTKNPLGKWSKLEMIAPGFEDEERHSHATYLEHEGKLWTFPARFGVGAKGRKFTGLGAEAWSLDEKTGKWQNHGRVIDNCWPYDEPVLMENRNFITGGQDKDGLPVVAISRGENLLKWDTVLIPYPKELGPNFAETTVWSEANEVMAVIRGGGGVAWVAISKDYGKTWAEAKPSNYPMPRSKAYFGKLSTGQLYLVSNQKDRNSMVVAVGKPGEKTLSGMWRIRHGSSKPIPRFKGHAKSAQWSYPYAHEHGGKLYIVYSIGKEDCGLSVIPIASLKTEK